MICQLIKTVRTILVCEWNDSDDIKMDMVMTRINIFSEDFHEYVWVYSDSIGQSLISNPNL